MRIMYREGLHGRPVVDASGHVLGEVDELFIDCVSWTVSSLRIKLRREAANAIGVSRGAFRAATLEIPSSAIQSVGDAVVLYRDAASLVPGETAEPQQIEPSTPPAPPH